MLLFFIKKDANYSRTYPRIYRFLFVGMIQEIQIGKDNIHIGRFVINPQKTGLGLGTEALKRFVDFIFKVDNIESISLTVFDFNQNAKKLYEKLGFEINEIIEVPKLKYIMRRHR